MSATADQKRIEGLYARFKKAPYGSRERRHLRRAVERAIDKAARSREQKAGRS